MSLCVRCAFTPGHEDIANARADVLEVIAHGHEPLYMLTDLETPYETYHQDGSPRSEEYPLVWAHHFLVADSQGMVHWMHPKLRAALGAITIEDIRAVLQNAPWAKNKEGVAHTFHQSACAALAGLDTRMEATEQLRRAILDLPPARDAQEAYAGLLHLFAAAPLPSSLAWAMANITLGVDMHDAFTHAYGPLSHIHAIARRIPLSSTPPSKMDAHKAFVTLYTQRVPTSAHVAVEHHIALLTVASAHAHGLYPASLRALHEHPDYICAVAAARIQQGS